MITLKVKTNNLVRYNEVLKRVELKFASRVMRGAMSDAANLLKEEVIARVPVRTGLLRRSVRSSVFNKRKNVIGWVTMGNEEAYYGRWIEGGARKHGIKPRRNSRGTRALSVNGKFYGYVRHPGIKARRPVGFAMFALRGDIIDTLEKGIEKRLTEVAKL